jgi:arylsulfatase A-like enzyme
LTLAEALKSHGYQTFFAGKWHLGDKGHLPTDQGFDFNIGGNNAGSPPGGYYGPWRNPNLTANYEGEYLTERLTAECVKFLETRNAEQPFLLYLSFYNVHTPITPYKKRIDHFRAKAKKQFPDATPQKAEHEGRSRLRQDHPEYASMIAAVDDSVGAVLKKLDELKLDDNTVVFFFSDNGGLCTLKNIGPTSNLPLRSGKGWLYEGGVREPAIIRAPGITKPKSVCDTPIVSMDFVPTILELAGLPLLPDRHADGTSLLPLLKGEELPERTFYWHYPHYHGSTWKPGASLRDGDWKLIEFYHDGKAELYHLKDDPGEQNDLSQAQTKKTQELRNKLAAWQKELKAKMPVPIQN